MLKVRNRKRLLKLFSLFFSIFIWLYVVSTAEIEIVKEIPIKISVPDRMAIANDIEKNVSYSLSGPGLFVRRFLHKDLEVVIDIENYYKRGISNYKINLDPYKFKLPLGVELTSIEPRFLDLRLEPLVSKKVAVKPNFSSQLNDEYKIVDITVLPKFVTVSGPRSIINRVKKLETKLIENIENVPAEGLRTKVEINTDKIKVDDSNILVNFVLKSKIVQKTMNDIPIIFQSNSLIKNISQKKINMVLEGDEKLMSQLEASGIQVLAIVPQKINGPTDIELITELPEGIKLISLEPSNVTVELENDQ